MIFETFDEPGLAQYAYAVGSEEAGAVAIVDPMRDVDRYLQFAEREGLAISHVLETHIHADFASGARELADLARAELCLSAYDEGEAFCARFPHRRLREGDAIEIGAARIVATHTPGHTPEHVSYLVYDLARSRETPVLMLTGDFIFVGSVGRPDLLGEEAKRGLAERLFESLRRTQRLPDGLEIHPGHGAGSMCGAGMCGRSLSTLGFERASNPYLDPRLGKEAFLARLLGSAPPFPEYYRRMKALNAAGPAPLGRAPRVPPLAAERFRALAQAGHVVVDLRDQLGFAGGHVPGAFGIGAGPKLSEWAAWVVPPETPILLVAPGEAAAGEAARALARVGLEPVAGFLEGGMSAWIEAGLPIRRTGTLAAVELGARLERGDLALIDVRSIAEWRLGHVRGARHIMGGELARRLDEVPHGKPLAVMCGSGYRSTVAASVLERAGFEDVSNLVGGMTAWSAARLPVASG
jgi:hydroxyacylglutathione hydrolase